jgi:hypothetical protein
VTAYFPPTVSGGASPTVTCTPPNGSVFPIGTTTITCNAVDEAQQTATCSTTLTVLAPPPPPPPPPPPALTIACPAPAPAYSPSGAAVKVTYNAPTTLGGLAPINKVCTPASGSLFAPGLTQVACTATDAAMQVATCSTSVVVNVPPPPVITCPVIATVTTKSAGGTKVAFATPKATGGATPVAVTCSPASGSKFSIGDTPVVCTAVDALKRSNSCTTSVTVERK